MAVNSNRGESHERRIGYLIGKLRQNMGFITEKDIEVLEWMGKKGDYDERVAVLKLKK